MPVDGDVARMTSFLRILQMGVEAVTIHFHAEGLC